MYLAGYFVFNGFIALDAFSAAPHRLGQGAFLVGTEIVSTVESSGEIKLLHVGFIWLAPEPSEKQKDHVKREILKMAMIDRERKVTR